MPWGLTQVCVGPSAVGSAPPPQSAERRCLQTCVLAPAHVYMCCLVACSGTLYLREARHGTRARAHICQRCNNAGINMCIHGTVLPYRGVTPLLGVAPSEKGIGLANVSGYVSVLCARRCVAVPAYCRYAVVASLARCTCRCAVIACRCTQSHPKTCHGARTGARVAQCGRQNAAAAYSGA
jgi:hypothetical protein